MENLHSKKNQGEIETKDTVNNEQIQIKNNDNNVTQKVSFQVQESLKLIKITQLAHSHKLNHLNVA